MGVLTPQMESVSYKSVGGNYAENTVTHKRATCGDTTTRYHLEAESKPSPDVKSTITLVLDCPSSSTLGNKDLMFITQSKAKKYNGAETALHMQSGGFISDDKCQDTQTRGIQGDKRPQDHGGRGRQAVNVRVTTSWKNE